MFSLYWVFYNHTCIISVPALEYLLLNLKNYVNEVERYTSWDNDHNILLAMLDIGIFLTPVVTCRLTIDWDWIELLD